MQLYGYWRSTAAYRVRIACGLKGLSPTLVPVHLVRDGGEQRTAEYLAINPLGLVPTLVVDGRRLTQSLAIIEWLDEQYPAPPLLPADAWTRAQVREIAQLIACDIHPVDNLRVLQYLGNTLGASEEQIRTWYRHWLVAGLEALESMLAANPSREHFCCGDTPTVADLCLVPQLYNARRFEIDLAPYPTLVAIDAACASLAAFQQAAPAMQPDAPDRVVT
jgi:maleylacetoacetate isomerase